MIYVSFPSAYQPLSDLLALFRHEQNHSFFKFFCRVGVIADAADIVYTHCFITFHHCINFASFYNVRTIIRELPGRNQELRENQFYYGIFEKFSLILEEKRIWSNRTGYAADKINPTFFFSSSFFE
jgi:hypothetical protein